MSLESVFILLNIVILAAGIATIIFAGRSYLRFLEGEFKTILRWVVYAYVLFILYKALNVVALMNVANLPFLLVLSDLVFLIAIVCVLVSVKELYTFSKTYGFRHHALPLKKKVLKKKRKKSRK